MIAIPVEMRERLSYLPEYGMGYQIGTVKLNTGGSESGIILNGSFFVTKQEIAGYIEITQIINEVRATIEKSKTSLSILSASLTPRPAGSLKGVKKLYLFSDSINKKAGAAEQSEIIQTLRNEIFKRFSAYEDDYRVTKNKGLTPGTFATTAEDAIKVKTGMDAISRYALENKKSANKVFTITPPEKTNLKRGIVQPAYGEIGGGAEVIFVDGTPDFTVTGPVLIPEK